MEWVGRVGRSAAACVPSRSEVVDHPKSDTAYIEQRQGACQCQAHNQRASRQCAENVDKIRDLLAATSMYSSFDKGSDVRI